MTSRGVFELSHRTKVVIGDGVWRRALPEVRALGERVLLVTGAAALSKSGVERTLLEEAARLGLTFSRFSVPREPDVELADRAATVARTERAQAVLAVGGGSVLDVAKAAAALATNEGSARDYLEGLPGAGPKAIRVPPLPVVCVPTTAGTGSEVTKNAVLQVADLRVKRSMRSDLIFPHSAFVDPSLSAGAPPLVRAGSGFDALTHLIEAFCSRNASAFTDALARDGIPRAVRGLRQLATGNAGDEDAFELALAATLGGMCLANAGLGAAHGLIAPLGGLYPNIPHGAGLACLLPATLNVNAWAGRDEPRVSARFVELAELLDGSGATIASAADRLVELRAKTGLPTLASYGRIDVEQVIASPSGSLKTNPVALGPEALRSIMELSLKP